MGRKATIDNFHNALISCSETNSAGYHLAGWSSSESQVARFNSLVRASQFKGGSVIDYGCGPGDLYAYLSSLGLPLEYRGLDHSEHMLTVARSRYGGQFEKIAFDAVCFGAADYVFASGVFQFVDLDKPQYHFELIAQLFASCKKALAVNLLSASRDDSNKVINELYLNPEAVVAFAKSKTKFWCIDHSYHQGGGDMTLALFNRDSDLTWRRPNLA
ncbi:class I SAM-dependent methyltransferase [Thiorhodococcus fuscus]|uniref:Class I SAM-dependent methyltransferase n=1 Tax=Thiorhodococcus fuscus TaxID=527200 RepID=A0ABW4Y600_9GAMM